MSDQAMQSKLNSSVKSIFVNFIKFPIELKTFYEVHFMIRITQVAVEIHLLGNIPPTLYRN